LSRYIPVVKQLGTQIIDGVLSTTEYPYIKDPGSSDSKQEKKSEGVSLRTKKTEATWASDKPNRRSEKSQTFVGGRIIIFIAGGMTMSEMRSGYELTKKFSREVIVGSTHVITPGKFIEGLRNLKKVEQLDTD